MLDELNEPTRAEIEAVERELADRKIAQLADRSTAELAEEGWAHITQRYKQIHREDFDTSLARDFWILYGVNAAMDEVLEQIPIMEQIQLNSFHMVKPLEVWEAEQMRANPRRTMSREGYARVNRALRNPELLDPWNAKLSHLISTGVTQELTLFDLLAEFAYMHRRLVPNFQLARNENLDLVDYNLIYHMTSENFDARADGEMPPLGRYQSERDSIDGTWMREAQRSVYYWLREHIFRWHALGKNGVAESIEREITHATLVINFDNGPMTWPSRAFYGMIPVPALSTMRFLDLFRLVLQQQPFV